MTAWCTQSITLERSATTGGAALSMQPPGAHSSIRCECVGAGVVQTVRDYGGEGGGGGAESGGALGLTGFRSSQAASVIVAVTIVKMRRIICTPSK